MISVCMTSYNGMQYIQKQIETILENLACEDELIISDDGSTDGTLELVGNLMKEDTRIRLINGPKKGVISNFENAIMEAKGDFIYLADQDDIWEPDKVAKVQRCFREQNCMGVIHDADIINEHEKVTEKSFFARRNSSAGVIKNIVKNTYIGCCMAFRREMLSCMLPIPKNIEMHDQWIGIIGDMMGGSYFHKEVLFHYRIQGSNVSSFEHYPVPKMIRNRVVLVIELTKRWVKTRGYKK